MSSFVPRHVLVTQAHMQRLMGSEIATLEVIGYFESIGCKVTLLTYALGEPVMSKLRNFSNLRILQIQIDDVDSALLEDLPDLAWVHHGLVPPILLEHPGKTKFIFNHMSTQLPIEFPHYFQLETSISSLSLFNAEKIKLTQIETGLYNELKIEQLQLFANPAPDEFKKVTNPTVLGRKPKLAVVSNHIPDEVITATELLSDQFDIVLVGSEKERGATPELVTPDLLANFDVIISIGKTVQYSLMSGKPIYCYDHFGGPGWITANNLNESGFDNFSGRGFSKKTPEVIVKEILSRNLSDTSESLELRDFASENYSLSTRMKEILRFIEAQPYRHWIFEQEFIASYRYNQGALAVYVRQWVMGLGEIELLSNQLHEMQKALTKAHHNLEQIKKVTGLTLLRKVVKK